MKFTDFDNILTCVHCGLCQDVCPTYRELGTEQDSPRGRLYLMRGLWENKLELTPEVVEPLSRCLDCRACETACPSKVPYGELLEKTRGVIHENKVQGIQEKWLREILLKRLLTNTGALLWTSRLMQVVTRLKIPQLITKTPLSKVLPPFIVDSQKLLPDFAGKSFKWEHADHSPYGPLKGIEKRARVGFFSGCIMDVAESSVHEATLKLLRAAGCEVVIPKNQSCCGALHVHSGDRETARNLAEKNLLAFGEEKLDAIITNAAGCGAQLKEYHHLFSKDDPRQQEWHALEQKMVDIMEYLSQVPELVEKLSWKTVEDTVLYDAPCHLQHAQGINANPQALLNRLPGVSLVPLHESDWCCGSAGIYNLLQPDLSSSVLSRKVDAVQKTLTKNPQAQTIVTGNPGCLFQIRGGVQSEDIPLRVIHPITYLAERLEA